VDAQGVWIGPGGAAAASMVISWDRVRSVEGEGAEEAAKFADVADAAWRARARLERGDLVAAEPMLERIFETYRGQRGPTAAVVAEGLLRCRVRRAAHVAAVEPWLALLAAKQGATNQWLHGDWAAQAGLGSVVDDATGLAPSLPPIWLNWPSVGAWARTQPAAEGDAKAALLAALYLASARFEVGMDAPLPEVVVNDPGVQIVADIVTARIGTEEQRQASRQRLRDRIAPATTPAQTPTAPWLEAWCRAGLGRSLVRETDAEQRRLGVVELLHVPARFRQAHPYLSAIALAEAAATLRDLGDDRGAGVLEEELRAIYPTHPVLDWNRLRPAPAASPSPAPAPARVVPGGERKEETGKEP
jgi:hypothetical protein